MAKDLPANFNWSSQSRVNGFGNLVPSVVDGGRSMIAALDIDFPSQVPSFEWRGKMKSDLLSFNRRVNEVTSFLPDHSLE